MKVITLLALVSTILSCSTSQDREILPGQCTDGERGIKFLLMKDTKIIGYCLNGDLIKFKEIN